MIFRIDLLEYKNRRKFKFLFIFLSLLILFVLLFFFFIRFDETVKVRGIVKGNTDSYELRIINSSKIKKIFFKENLIVNKGDILFITDNEFFIDKKEMIIKEKEKIESQLSIYKRLLELLDLDLEYSECDLNSSIIAKTFFDIENFKMQMTTLEKEIEIEKNTSPYLYIPKKIDDLDQQLNLLKNSLNVYKNEKKNFFREKILDFESQLNNYNIELLKLDDEISNTIYSAPFDGIVKENMELCCGQAVFSEDLILTIIPLLEKEIYIEGLVDCKYFNFLSQKTPLIFYYNIGNKKIRIDARIIDIFQICESNNDISFLKFKALIEQNKTVKNFFYGQNLDGFFILKKQTLCEKLLFDFYD